RTNYRIEKIRYYHIVLFRLSSRVRDKWTRTTDIRYKDPTIGKPGMAKIFPPSDSLILRMLVLRMSDCPSPTLTAQPESG
ncbi:hypothetical protein Gogos_012023, partial [Gossypium gossypioides]|nr:hypothetical protein [Gossypium gossypioides]